MRNILAGGLIAVVFAAAAGEFPYDAPMRVCHETNDLAVASLEIPVSVPEVNGGMDATNSIAVVSMTDTLVQAMDLDDWTASTNHLASQTTVQAAFSLVADEFGGMTTLKWMGFTGGSWVELSGFAAAEGTYDVKIDLDYSLSKNPSGEPKIRYSIREGSSTGEYTALTCSSKAWMAIGASRMKVNGVDVYGFMTNVDVVAEAGARPAEGSVATVQDVGMNYDSITLQVVSSDTWGVSTVKVVVKNEEGTVLTNATQAIAVSGTNDFVFASVIPGKTYSYEVNLEGSYAESTIATATTPGGVDMFSTNSWFYFSGTDFVHANTNGNITVADGKFFATDDEQEGTISPTNSPANVGTVVMSTMEISGVCTEMPAFASDAPQFAVALGKDNDDRVWKYYSEGAWSNAPSGLPTDDGTYEGRATFDYVAHKVKYEIRLATDAGSRFETLATANLPGGKDALAAVAVCGGGSVSKLDATLKLAEPAPVVPVGDTITVTKNADLKLDAVASGDYTVTLSDGAHLKWTDADNKCAKVVNGKLSVLGKNPANGLKSYNSFVLGLDPEKENDKPAAVIKPGVDQTGGMKVYVPNITVNTECGYKVKLLRQYSTDGGNTWTDDGEYESGAEVTIPFANNKLYRVNTILK